MTEPGTLAGIIAAHAEHVYAVDGHSADEGPYVEREGCICGDSSDYAEHLAAVIKSRIVVLK